MLLNILLVILTLIGIALTGIILLQRSEGGGLVSGGGGGQFMTARGTANLLTKTTQILAAIFFSLILAITIVSGRTSKTGESVVDRAQVQGLDPAAMAAQKERERQAAIAAEKAKQEQSSGFGAPAPTLGAPPAAPAQPFGADPFAPAQPKR